MTKKVTVKAKMGRPSPYKPEYCRMAYRHTLLGATDVQLAELFGVTTTTLNNWKRLYPEFIASIKDGKEEADADVIASLYKRARGYSHRAVKIFCSKDGEVTQVPYIERYPPDATSMIFWLKNRQPKQWRDKQEVELGELTVAALLQKPLDELRKLQATLDKGA